MGTTQQQVNDFLKEFKAIMTRGSEFYVVERLERNKSVTALGLTRRIVELELLTLSVMDYSSGPEPDKDRPGVVWKFGKIVNSHEIYIKLKTADVKGTKKAICVSFHEAEYPLNYPLKS